ncbi:MAG TPA: alpha-(1-_3)-arabinofuranosyltransferase family protein [Thermoleophilaceae bacterium]
MTLALVQRPGWASSDTKIDLHVSPGRFLSEVASAWTPNGTLGQVWSGQYDGYLWPMGPFFALGHALGIAPWLVDRLWLALVLALASWGTVRLLDALLDRPRGAAHLAAGLIVLLNPYVVVFTNRTTFFLLGYAALPWLLLVVHRGLRSARSWWWPAAAALIVTSMGGGVNATVTAFMLLGPLLLLLYEPLVLGLPWRAVRDFCLRAIPLMLLASLWWIVPVLVAAKFGLDFLPFTEHPGSIWATTSLTESLRLMGYWLSYLGVGYGSHLESYFSDSGLLLFNPAVVAATLLVPALSLAGFVWTRRWRYGPYLLALVLLGLLVMTVGWPEGTPLRHGLNFTYNHSNSVHFLRTTYKAGPLVALGLACLGGVAAAELWRRARGTAVRVVVACVGAALLALSAWPLVSGRAIDKQVSWKRIPAAWTQAGHDLNRQLPRNSRAVVLPGQAFAFYKWGGTVDPILPALTKRPVSVKNVPPYADEHAIDIFWTIDSLVQQQRLVPGELPPLLGLIGARSVITGSDDNAELSGAMAPADAARTLAPQLGPPARRYGPQTTFKPSVGELGAPVRLPEVRRYDLPAARGIVRVEPLTGQTVIDGSAAGVAELAALGALPRQAFEYAGDLGADALGADAARSGNVVISDSNRRQVFVASRLRQNSGTTLSATDPISKDAAQLNPFAERGTDGQTVAVYHGASYVRAPSSPGFAQFPEHRPYAAFDGSPRTFWEADPALARDQSWLEVGFRRPRDVDHIDLLPHADPRLRVAQVMVGGKRFDVHPGWNRLDLGLRAVRNLRVTITKISPAPGVSDYVGGIDEVEVPGLHVTEALRVPVLAERALAGQKLGGTGLTYLFSRTTGDDPFARGSVPAPALTKRRFDTAESEPYYVRNAGDGEAGLDRLFSPPAARSWRADGWVTVRPATRDLALDRLAGYRGAAGFDSSSRFEGQPRFRASSAFDGTTARAWVAGWNPFRRAWLSWSTPRPVTLTTLHIAPPPPGVRVPASVRLSWPSGSSPRLAVSPAGDVTLRAPVRAERFRLDILSTRLPHGASGAPLAVGIGELSGPGVPHVSVPLTGNVTATCGALRATVGGQTLALRPVGSVAALDRGTPLRALPCGPAASLPAGPAELRTLPGAFDPYFLRLASPVAHAAPAPSGRVLDSGSEGNGSHKHVRVRLSGPSLVVLGESYNRGWRATCNGHSLGTPLVVDGYANGWEAGASCRDLSFTFGPNRWLDVGYFVSAAACMAMLALLLFTRPRRGAPEERGELELDDTPQRWRPAHALAAGVVAALVLGFVFALRVGGIAGPCIALLLWRGVPARKLILWAGGLLVIAVPLIYLIWPAANRGGYNNDYAADHIGANWVAVAAYVLLLLGLAMTLSTATRRSRAAAREAAAAPAAEP